MRRFLALLALALLPFSAQTQERGAPLPRKGFLGVASAPDPKGVKVVRVVAGSTFEKLGLKADDIVLELNGGRLTEPPN
jgi:S1-C subfamily serine protease